MVFLLGPDWNLLRSMRLPKGGGRVLSIMPPCRVSFLSEISDT